MAPEDILLSEEIGLLSRFVTRKLVIIYLTILDKHTPQKHLLLSVTTTKKRGQSDPSGSEVAKV